MRRSVQRLGRRPARRIAPDDRGDTSVQIVITVPVIVLVVMLGVQMAVWYHAANVARSAAAQGASAGAVRDAGSGVARARADQVIAENGATGTAAASRSTEVTVRVTIDVSHIVPFFPDTVTVSATEAVERFIAEDER